MKIFAGSNQRGEGEVRNLNKWIPNPIFGDKISDLPDYQKYLKIRNYSDEEKYRNLFRRKYDIGLIKLDTPFTHKYEGRRYLINTVCLPQRGVDPGNAPGNATFFGFGSVEEGKFWNTKAIFY